MAAYKDKAKKGIYITAENHLWLGEVAKRESRSMEAQLNVMLRAMRAKEAIENGA